MDIEVGLPDMRSVMSSDEFYSATPTIESDSPVIKDFATVHAAGGEPDAEQAVRLFYAVRDSIRYDPYHIDLSVQGMKASTTLFGSLRARSTRSINAIQYAVAFFSKLDTL
jgi:hypothetical protein